MSLTLKQIAHLHELRKQANCYYSSINYDLITYQIIHSLAKLQEQAYRGEITNLEYLATELVESSKRWGHIEDYFTSNWHWPKTPKTDFVISFQRPNNDHIYYTQVWLCLPSAERRGSLMDTDLKPFARGEYGIESVSIKQMLELKKEYTVFSGVDIREYIKDIAL